MKIVIDIDDYKYTEIREDSEKFKSKGMVVPYLYKVIESGIPLPKYFTECEQEPKTGHWITRWYVAHQKEYYYCSECREEFSYDGETGIKMNDYTYCPNCGAKMIELLKSEEI